MSGVALQHLWKVRQFFSRPFVVDGGMGTELESRGYNVNDPLWSARMLAENPGAVQQVHYDHLLSGAHMLVTSSYQASIEGLMRPRQGGASPMAATPGQAGGILARSVQVARAAVADYHRKLDADAVGRALASGSNTNTGTPTNSPQNNGFNRPPAATVGSTPNIPTTRAFLASSRNILVAGSVGPYGAYLADGSEYTGAYCGTVRPEVLREFHLPRIAALVDAGADLIAFETYPNETEAALCAELMVRHFPHVPFYASFTLHPSTPSHVSPATEKQEITDVLLPSGTSFVEARRVLIQAVGAALTETTSAGSPMNNGPSLGSIWPLVAVGANCCPPGCIDALLSHVTTWLSFHGHKSSVCHLPFVPLVLYPNSGETWIPGERTWRGAHHSFFTNAVAWWSHTVPTAVLRACSGNNSPETFTRVVSGVGGCCRSRPKDVNLVHEAWEAVRRKANV